MCESIPNIGGFEKKIGDFRRLVDFDSRCLDGK